MRSKTTWLYTEVTRGCSKEFSKASGSERNTSYLLYRFTTEEEREEDQRTARCHASKFCVVHCTHIMELERHLRCRDKAALQNRWLSRGRRLAGLPSSAMRPVDRQAVPIWPLSGDSPAVFRGQTGDWGVSRYGCSNLQATYNLGERRLAHVTAHAS